MGSDQKLKFCSRSTEAILSLLGKALGIQFNLRKSFTLSFVCSCGQRPALIYHNGFLTTNRPYRRNVHFPQPSSTLELKSLGMAILKVQKTENSHLSGRFKSDVLIIGQFVFFLHATPANAYAAIIHSMVSESAI